MSQGLFYGDFNRREWNYLSKSGLIIKIFKIVSHEIMNVLSSDLKLVNLMLNGIFYFFY